MSWAAVSRSGGGKLRLGQIPPKPLSSSSSSSAAASAADPLSLLSRETMSRAAEETCMHPSSSIPGVPERPWKDRGWGERLGETGREKAGGCWNSSSSSSLSSSSSSSFRRFSSDSCRENDLPRASLGGLEEEEECPSEDQELRLLLRERKKAAPAIW